MIVEPSTSKYAIMFPYPMLLLKIKQEGDTILDLNFLSFEKTASEKEKIINECLSILENHNYDHIIVNVGEYAPDGHYSKWIEYFLKKVKTPIEIMGPYVDTFKDNITLYCNSLITKKRGGNPDLQYDLLKTDYDISNVVIPMDMIEEYPKPGGKLKTNLKITYGCPRTCNMCPVYTIYKGKYEYKDIQGSLEIVKNYYDKGVRFFNFTDDNMSANVKKTKEFLSGLLKLNLKDAKFSNQEGFEVVAFLDDEFCKLLKEVKWIEPKVGVENIKDEFLKAIGKYYTSHDIVIQALSNITKYKLDVKFFFLMGYFQNNEDILDNIKFFVNNNLPIRCNIIRKYEGNKMDEDLPILSTDIEMRHLKALAYSASWWKTTLKINIFSKDDYVKYIEKYNITIRSGRDLNDDKITFNFDQAKTYFGFKTSKWITGMEYMIKNNLDLNVKIDYDMDKKVINNITKK
jgi:radical SAM superfamily enzyme YgiQ (UPF0313 family)